MWAGDRDVDGPTEGPGVLLHAGGSLGGSDLGGSGDKNLEGLLVVQGGGLGASPPVEQRIELEGLADGGGVELSHEGSTMEALCDQSVALKLDQGLADWSSTDAQLGGNGLDLQAIAAAQRAVEQLGGDVFGDGVGGLLANERAHRLRRPCRAGHGPETGCNALVGRTNFSLPSVSRVSEGCIGCCSRLS